MFLFFPEIERANKGRGRVLGGGGTNHVETNGLKKGMEKFKGRGQVVVSKICLDIWTTPASVCNPNIDH